MADLTGEAEGRSDHLHRDLPLVTVLSSMVLVVGTILLLQILLQRDLYLVNRFYLGMDYSDFYRGSQQLLEGGSPYDERRYVTPPLPAIVNLPLARLPLAAATYIVVPLVLLTMLSAMLFLRRAFSRGPWRNDLLFLPVAMALLCFSYPFWFLFDRGNIDGFVLLLVAVGLANVGKRDGLAGVAFGLAVASKIYPVLVVLPLLGSRRWKTLVVLGATVAVSVLCAPTLWLDYVQERLISRNLGFRADENGSIGATFYYLGTLLDHLSSGIVGRRLGGPFSWLGILFYLALLGTVGWTDLRRPPTRDRRELRWRIATYFPFMVAVPRLVYHYEFVFVLAILPAISWYWDGARKRSERRLLVLVSAGIAASQFPAVAVATLLGNMSAHFVPGLGALLVMVGLTALRLLHSEPGASVVGVPTPAPSKAEIAEPGSI